MVRGGIEFKIRNASGFVFADKWHAFGIAIATALHVVMAPSRITAHTEASTAALHGVVRSPRITPRVIPNNVYTAGILAGEAIVKGSMRIEHLWVNIPFCLEGPPTTGVCHCPMSSGNREYT